MPSGILQGKGCHDSLQRSDHDDLLYLSIRHHNTAFIVEKQRAMEEATKAKIEKKKSFEDIAAEKFAAGALPFLRKLVRGICLIIIAPFNFIFYHLPMLIQKRAITPVVKIINNVVERIVSPFVKAYNTITRPIKVISNKITDARTGTIAALERPFIAFQKKVKQLKSQILAPFQRLLERCCVFMRQLRGTITKAVKMTLAYSKLLVRYGLEEARNKGKVPDSTINE